jgi:uncharacterized membrane protein YjfL (UPF0719 family)
MWTSLLMSTLFGLLGIVLASVGYKLFDLIETKVDFAEEIRKGNMAAAVVVAAFLVGICYIIGRTVGS